MKSKKPENGDELPIRNSTAEFLVFAKDNAADTIAVRFQDRMLWLTLQLIADLFEIDKSVVSRHLTNIYSDGELDKSSTIAKYATVRQEGSRKVERQLEYYNLEAIIAVGYRVNSSRATLTGNPGDQRFFSHFRPLFLSLDPLARTMPSSGCT